MAKASKPTQRKPWQQVDKQTLLQRESDWAQELQAYRSPMEIKKWREFHETHCPPLTEDAGKITRSQILWNERSRHEQSGYVSNVSKDILLSHQPSPTQYSFGIDHHSPRIPCRPKEMRPVAYEETLSLGRNPILLGFQSPLIPPKETSSGYNPVTHRYRSEQVGHTQGIANDAEAARQRLQTFQSLRLEETQKQTEFRSPEVTKFSSPRRPEFEASNLKIPTAVIPRDKYIGAASMHFENERVKRTTLFLPSGRRLTQSLQEKSAQRTYDNDSYAKLIYSSEPVNPITDLGITKRRKSLDQQWSKEVERCLRMQVPNVNAAMQDQNNYK